MEQLTDAQQTAVKKTSSDRLRLMLLKAGYDEEIILGLNRDELMTKYAEILIYEDSDHKETAQIDPDQADRDRDWYEHELMMKRMELETHERIEREKLALEHEKLAIERAKLKKKGEIKQAEIDAKFCAENDEICLLKHYGEALAQVLDPQTDKVTELPA